MWESVFELIKFIINYDPTMAYLHISTLENMFRTVTYLGNRKKEYFGKRIQLHHGNGVRKRGLKMRKHQMKTKIANQKKTKVNPPLGVF